MLSVTENAPAHAGLFQHFWRHWWLKASGSTIFIWGFFQGYFFLLHYPHARVHVMPLTWVDRMLPMQWWSWFPYLSLWVYACLPVALMRSIRDMAYYGLAVGGVCIVGLICFYLWPTVIPPVARPEGMGLTFLQGVDTTGNACPSLHVAIAIYSALWLRHQVRQAGSAHIWHLINWIWGLAIVYSTLATKQHVLIDALGGAVLGAVGALLALRFYVSQAWGGAARHGPTR